MDEISEEFRDLSDSINMGVRNNDFSKQGLEREIYKVS